MALVVPPEGRRHRQTLEHAFTAAGVTWAAAAEADGWDVLVHLVELGLGSAVVNGCVPCPPSLVAIPISDLPRVTYWFTWRRGNSESANLILEHFRRRG